MSFKLIYNVFHKNIQFSDTEASLLKHPFLNRLHQIIHSSTAFFGISW